MSTLSTFTHLKLHVLLTSRNLFIHNCTRGLTSIISAAYEFKKAYAFLRVSTLTARYWCTTSVCLSVRLFNAGIVSKRLYESSNVFSDLVGVSSFYFFESTSITKIRR